MPAWRMCVSWTSSVHKPPKPQRFSVQPLLVPQNWHMHLLHYLGGDQELIFPKISRKVVYLHWSEEKKPVPMKGTRRFLLRSQLPLKSKYEVTTKLWLNSVLVLNSQSSSKFIESNPTTQRIVFPSVSIHFCFLRLPQHFYTNLSHSNFPV